MLVDSVAGEAATPYDHITSSEISLFNASMFNTNIIYLYMGFLSTQGRKYRHP